MLKRGYSFSITILTWVFVLPANAITPADLLPPHTAHYSLYKNGFPVASSRFRLNMSDNKIDYYSDTELSGLVSLFGNDKVSEHSQLMIHNSQIQLLSYTYQQTGDEKKTIESRFNWSDFTMSTRIDRDSKSQLPFKDIVWDKLSVNLALVQHAKLTQDQPSSVAFNVADEGQITTYRFEYAGAREIEVHSDEWIKTVIWKRTHDDAKKSTIIYLAPALQYLPVQLEQYKHNTLRATLKLDQVNW